ncbi:hypothetical protein LEMLEM_LOCUS5331, partial [Lemmus lemmus]
PAHSKSPYLSSCAPRIGVPSLPALPSTKRLPIKRDLGRIFVCGSFSCGTGARHNWCRSPGTLGLLRYRALGTLKIQNPTRGSGDVSGIEKHRFGFRVV